MKRFSFILLLLFVCGSVQAQTSTVTWSTIHQTVDGFGGEDWVCCESLTTAQANAFFSSSSGIGLSIIRTGNYGCPSTGACSVTTGNIPDLGTLQKATALGATVDLNIASPPASLKYSGTFSDGTAGASGSCLATSNYSAYATFMVQWIQLLEANSVPISIIDVANEPDSPSPTSNSLGACFWTAAQLDSYIGTYLGPALSSAGLSSVKVMMPNTGYWFGGASGDLYSTCLADSTCKQYIGVVATQGYGNSGSPDGFTPQTGYCCSTYTAPPSNVLPYHVWQSEINGGATYNSTAGLWNWDASMSPDAMVWARNIHDAIITGNISAWEYWQLADCCNAESGSPFNDGLMQSNLTTASKRMYVVGNWSKFVRPGWVRIDTGAGTGVSGVYITAFKSGTQYAIVAVNTNSGTTAQTFSLSGFPSTASVTPWLTNSSTNLVAQSTIAVSGSAFTASLSGESVTTFVGTAGTAGPGTYVSNLGGNFSGGSACNGQSTISESTFNSTTLAAGSTYYLCGKLLSALNINGAAGTSGSPINIIFDLASSVSPPNVGQGGSAVTLNSNYVTLGGITACGPGTTCATNENNSPTGYPANITGIVELTNSGTPGQTCALGPCSNISSASLTSYTQSSATCSPITNACYPITVNSTLNPQVNNYVYITGASPSGYDLYWKVTSTSATSFTAEWAAGTPTSSIICCFAAGSGGTGENIAPNANLISTNGGSNNIIQNLILRNLYVHPANSAGLSDPIGGGGAFSAWSITNSSGTSVLNCDIHDVDTAVNMANGPQYSNFVFKYNLVFNHNWGVHAGTYGGQVQSNWEIAYNKFGNMSNWDQNFDNAHHDQVLFLSRGGSAQGSGSFNRIAVHDNWATGQTGNNTTASIYMSGGPVTNFFLYNNVWDFSSSTYHEFSDGVLTMIAGVGSSFIIANNTIIGTPTFSGSSNNCYQFSAEMTFVNNVGKSCNAYDIWQNYDAGGGNTWSGLFDYNFFGETTGGGAYTFQVLTNTGTTGTSVGADTLAAYQSNLVTMGCVVGSYGCETHSYYNATVGSLDLGTSGLPTSSSPVVNAGTNLTSLCSSDTLLAGLCKDTSLGGTRTQVARPSSGSWWAGAYSSSTGGGGSPPQVNAPVFNPSPGTYTSSVSVSITTSTTGATIYYTTNGSTPTCSSTTYSSPIAVFSTTTILAIACASGYSNSSVTNGLYTITASSSPAWPLKASGRTLVDQSGNYVMLVFDSPWTLMCSMTPTQMASFFADRAAKGFNAILMHVIPSGPDGDGCLNTDQTQDGILPFTACISCTYPSGATENNYNYADPNSAYFTEVDNAINLAATYGLTVILGSFSTAGTNSAGTSITSGPLIALRLSGNSNAAATSFGQYLGNRYKNFSNIVWFTGEDFQSWPSGTTYSGYTDNQLVSAIATGIAAKDSNHLMMEELNYLISYGSQDSAFSASQTVNAVYSYSGYDTQYLAYAASSQPNIWIEGYYEFNQVYNYLAPFPISGVNNGACTGAGNNVPPGTGSPLYDLEARLGLWWAVTTGSLGGVSYGSCTTGNSMIPAAFLTYIDTPGAAQIKPFVQFWANLQWWLMAPDTTHQVVTAGYGTYEAGSSGCNAGGTGSAGACNLFSDNYVTCLLNSADTAAVCYNPAGNLLTINLGLFSGSTVAASWYDPTNGTSKSISGSPFVNSGTTTLSSPGSNSRGEPDWVLLLQSSGVPPLPSAATPLCSQGSGNFTAPFTTTCTTSSPAAVLCYTTNGETPQTNGSTGCTVGTQVSGAITISVSTTLKVIAGGTGYLDSTILTDIFIFAVPASAATPQLIM